MEDKHNAAHEGRGQAHRCAPQRKAAARQGAAHRWEDEAGQAEAGHPLGAALAGLRSAGDRSRRLAPGYDHREYHEHLVRAAPGEALARHSASRPRPTGSWSALFRLRGLKPRGKSLEQLFAPPWADGARTDGDGVRRAAQRDAGADRLRPPRAAGGGRSVLSTETRIAGGGLRFRAYWLVVRPFSGLIRRRWLIAAAKRAAAPSAVPQVQRGLGDLELEHEPAHQVDAAVEEAFGKRPPRRRRARRGSPRPAPAPRPGRRRRALRPPAAARGGGRACE